MQCVTAATAATAAVRPLPATAVRGNCISSATPVMRVPLRQSHPATPTSSMGPAHGAKLSQLGNTKPVANAYTSTTHVVITDR